MDRQAGVLPSKASNPIAWDNLRMGMGKRTRRRGDYLLILQKPPITAISWRDHGIPSRWSEKVDTREHPHVKPMGLIARLIGAVTEPGDLVVDPAGGGFGVMHVARRLERNFTGCDITYRPSVDVGGPTRSSHRSVKRLKPTISAGNRRSRWRPRASVPARAGSPSTERKWMP